MLGRENPLFSFFFFLSLKLYSLSMLDEYVSEKNSGQKI